MKLRVEELEGIPLAAVVVEMDFLSGREALEQALDAVTARRAIANASDEASTV